MSTVRPAVVVVADVVKAYAGGAPLRVTRLVIDATDQLVLVGLDRAAAETLIHLITGAAVPDEGSIRVAGRDTREIATDQEWLLSLDRFGIVTDRAVLIAQLPIVANMALPLTLTIDPLDEAIRARVEALADRVRLPRARLDAPAGSLSIEERWRVHLARALATTPELLLLEYPTAGIDDPGAKARLGETLRAATGPSNTGWLALTDDLIFARAAGGVTRRLDAATGVLAGEGFWDRLRSRFSRGA